MCCCYCQCRWINLEFLFIFFYIQKLLWNHFHDIQDARRMTVDGDNSDMTFCEVNTRAQTYFWHLKLPSREMFKKLMEIKKKI